MFKIETIGSGFIAIMAYPGKEQDAASAIASLAHAGIRQVVSLLEPAEAAALGLEGEAQLVAAESMTFVSFPIPDMGLPASVYAFAGLARELYRQVTAGDNTLLHCRGGVGRSGLLAAAVLLHCGMDPHQACERVTHLRGLRVPETPEQGVWLLANHAAIRAAKVTG
ncbi:MAG: tyrosine protein phosphatase [Gammaproteobacteria bacterium]|nr:tyrosine protein phosphatase [Gammaproteobacteria bacterium]